MTIKMKALRSFGTKKAGEGHVRRGREFDAVDESRAKELETRGFAHRVETKAEPALQNKMQQPPPQNKAASVGPLPSRGGETGAEAAPSSSDQDRPQRGRGSRKPRGGLDL